MADLMWATHLCACCCWTPLREMSHCNFHSADFVCECLKQALQKQEQHIPDLLDTPGAGVLLLCLVWAGSFTLYFLLWFREQVGTLLDCIWCSTHRLCHLEAFASFVYKFLFFPTINYFSLNIVSFFPWLSCDAYGSHSCLVIMIHGTK